VMLPYRTRCAALQSRPSGLARFASAVLLS
jgi:hypothetical protein